MPSADTSSSSLWGRMSTRNSFLSKKDVKVTVQLLEETETVINEFKRSQTGQDVLDYVCECLNLKEKDYFGLRYQDHHRHRYWVDLSQPLSHICKLLNCQFNIFNCQITPDNLSLCLRFRYYPSDVNQLKEELTRYQLVVQLQRDLLHGRLYCPQSIAVKVAALILQSQLGDYDESANGNYVSEFKLLVKQTPKMEEKIAENHKELKGMSTSEAELQFLQLASEVETYGFDPFTVKESKNPSVSGYIGATHKGVLIYHGSQKVHQLKWSDLSKVDYIRNELILMPTEEYQPHIVPVIPNLNNNNTAVEANGFAKVDSKKPQSRVLRYTCPSRTYAKHLWVHILSQKAFFNEASAQFIRPLFSKPRIPLLTRGTTFRFPSQRVLREIESNPSVEEPREISFSRYPLPRQNPRQEQPWLNKYNTLPNLKANAGGSSELPFDGNEQKATISTSRSLEATTNLFNDAPKGVAQGEPGTSQEVDQPFQKKLEGGQKVQRNEDAAPKENVTTFTVRLVKVERADGSRLVQSVMETPIGSPLATSTPRKVSSRCSSNGVVPNGTGYAKEEIDLPKPKVSGIGPTVVNTVFLSLLVILLIIGIAIALFEEFSFLEEEYGAVARVRHDLYEPARAFVLGHYNAVFNR